MQRLSASKILVTGAAGFIGSHIVEEAIKQGVYVVGVDNLVAGKLDNLQEALKSPLFEFRQANIEKDSMLSKSYPDIEVIFHNAASKCTVCRANPTVDLMTNALGTLRVAEAAMEIGAHLVHASTGSTNRGNPRSFYGVSKLTAEHYIKLLGLEGLKYSGLRYHHVFGPRQAYDDLGGVIPIFIRNVAMNQPIRIFGDGTQVRYFTFVKDVVEANFIVANKGPLKSTVDLAASEVCTIYELASLIRMGMTISTHPIKCYPEKPGDIYDFTIYRRQMEDLGWTPKNGFHHNLQKTIDWYVENVWRYSCNMKGR
jgi:nucleoside-diphosphate-sugar epimerase